jgi:hypothetical protein
MAPSLVRRALGPPPSINGPALDAILGAGGYRQIARSDVALNNGLITGMVA